MNCKVNFFTPITFKNQKKTFFDTCLETIDSYFYLGGKKAFVSTLIPTSPHTKKVVLSYDKTSIFTTMAKIISYTSLILPLIMLAGKVMFRRTSKFKVVNVQQHLTRIELSQELIENVKTIFSQDNISQHFKFLEQKRTITNYPSRFNIFSFNKHPDLIFKAATIRKNTHRSTIPNRLKNMIAAEEIRLAYNLDKLIIPRAQGWHLETKGCQLALIAEEKFDIQTNHNDQEELYRSLKGLDETIHQLAFFITKTGFSDVDHRNIPIIIDHEGQKRIVLVDLEEMNSAQEGIYGNKKFSRKGLICCLGTEKHIDIVLQEASRLGVFYSSSDPTITAEDIKRERLEQLQSFKDLDEFYKEKQLLSNQNQKIILKDYSELGLNIEEKIFIHGKNKPPIRMQKAIKNVISTINNLIEKSNAYSIRAKRITYLNLLTPSEKSITNYFYYLDQENPRIENPLSGKNTLLYRICRALKEKKYIFNYFVERGMFIIQG